ncbi:MAG: fibronectin type III-like domain-contianing protein [Acidimicrobiales bacterium]
MYVRDLESSVQRPAHELRAFSRVALAPGQSRTVSFDLDHQAFAYWHEGTGDWYLEPGEFRVCVGASSRDIRLEASVALDGDDLVIPLQPDSTANAWFAHATGGPWLREALGDGHFGRLLASESHGKMYRAVPLQRMSRMLGFPVSEDELIAAVARHNA